MKGLGESESKGVKLKYRVRRLGRDLARAALVGIHSRSETGKKNLSSVRAECQKHPKFLPSENSSSRMFCYFCVSRVIIISLDRDIIQPLTDLTKKKQYFKWVSAQADTLRRVHDVVNSDRVLAYWSTNLEHTLNPMQTRATSVCHSGWRGNRTFHRFWQSAAEFSQEEAARYRETAFLISLIAIPWPTLTRAISLSHTRPLPPCGSLPFYYLLCKRTNSYPITLLPIVSGYFRAKPSPIWIPQLFSNLVIIHLLAYEAGTDRVFRNVGI